MSAQRADLILIVEDNPEISDLLAHQALEAVGYRTELAMNAATAIARVRKNPPDAIIVDLSLPGLSGKDLIAACSAQGVQAPVIVVARSGAEKDIIQAFRLGAADYLQYPMGEAEIIHVVERVLEQVHARRERDRLAAQFQKANQELQQRVLELTTLYDIGKIVVSTTDQVLLFEKILDGAAHVTWSDYGWFLLWDESKRKFLLSAQRNLPESYKARLNSPWDEEVGAQVALSGKPLCLSGEAVKKYKISNLGESLMIVPVKAQKLVIGLLAVMRKKPVAFTTDEQRLMELVADYASISIVNARLFRAVEERALSLQTLADESQAREKIANAILQAVKTEIIPPLEQMNSNLDRISKSQAVKVDASVWRALAAIEEKTSLLTQVADSISPLPLSTARRNKGKTNLNELMWESVHRHEIYSMKHDLTISVELPADPLFMKIDTVQLSYVMDGLISNAIRFSTPGGVVTVRMELIGTDKVHILVKDTGSGMDAYQLKHLFEPAEINQDPISFGKRFGGLGISMNLVKEIVQLLGGEIRAESKLGKGSSLHIQLPLSK